MVTGGTFAGIGWDEKLSVAWCAHEETREEQVVKAGNSVLRPPQLALPISGKARKRLIITSHPVGGGDDDD